jgi:hypothetical protein
MLELVRRMAMCGRVDRTTPNGSVGRTSIDLVFLDFRLLIRCRCALI